MKFMSILMFLAGSETNTTSSTGLSSNDPCQGIGSVIGIAKIIVNLIQVIVPIALIIWGSIDMLKAIIAGDEKKISAARKPLIQRVISAVIVFLLPWAFNAIITLVARGDSTTKWVKCWKDQSSTFSGQTIDTDISSWD